LNKYRTRVFKCYADAEKEIELLETKVIKKLKYHKLEISIQEQEKKRPGRPSKDLKKNRLIKEYKLEWDILIDKTSIEESIRRECTFILCSNDLSISGEKMIREYKTQSDVEKRFRVLKAPTFMNSLFLKTPQRVETLVYLLLISLMMMTVAERVVRDELKKNNDVVLGIEKRKQKQPTLTTILKIMNRIRVVTYFSSGKIVRKIINMDESCQRSLGILNYQRTVLLGTAMISGDKYGIF